jgi:carbon storage regulator
LEKKRSFVPIQAGTLAKIGDLILKVQLYPIGPRFGENRTPLPLFRYRRFPFPGVRRLLATQKMLKNEHFPLAHSQNRFLVRPLPQKKAARLGEQQMSPISRRIVMLVLSRKQGEQVIIGNGITVTLVELTGNRARLGIEAPDQVPILRGELPFWQGAQPGNKEPFEPAFVCEW